jgi:hypothetical protein
VTCAALICPLGLKEPARVTCARAATTCEFRSRRTQESRNPLASGSVNVDYLLADGGVPRDIDAIPRLVEPVNAAFSGVNLADLPVRLSLGVSLDLVEGHPGVTSHMLVQALLGVADRGGTWPGNWPEPRPARGSTPGVGRSAPPVLHDPPSALPLTVVDAQLLAAPASAASRGERTVSDYAPSPSATRIIAELPADG